MKSKGGRAKKAQYTTVVMRIPTPIKAEVERLLAKFYASLSEKAVTGIESVEGEKGVTGIESVEVEKPVTGIESLNLPIKCLKILKRKQINTVDDLLALSDIRSNLNHVAGLGKKSLETIENALLKYR